jgi:pimeloyl-ACP methyl ester carboxylesterase
LFEIITNGLIFSTLIFGALFIFTQIKTNEISKTYPPIGDFRDLDGTRIHYKFVKADDNSDLPALIFIHGASGNLRDQTEPFFNKLKGRANLLFIDRPGHGWSERSSEDQKFPDKQALIISKLMSALDLQNGIIVGHSFGCAVTASFALNHHEKTKGLLFLAPAAYPWPGGVAWYYSLTSMPFIGWLFANTLALPSGLKRVESGSRCVFLPNIMPSNYIENTGPSLVLRPRSFRSNAKDITALFNYLVKTWPRYKTIKSPTIIISGDKDNVVFPYIHSRGLEQHIENAELISLDNVGHKPDYAAVDIAIAAIENLSGKSKHDLKKMAAELDKELSDQQVESHSLPVNY